LLILLHLFYFIESERGRRNGEVLTCRPDYRSAAGRNVRVSTAFQIYLDTRGEISRRRGKYGITDWVSVGHLAYTYSTSYKHTRFGGRGEGGGWWNFISERWVLHFFNAVGKVKTELETFLKLIFIKMFKRIYKYCISLRNIHEKVEEHITILKIWSICKYAEITKICTENGYALSFYLSRVQYSVQCVLYSTFLSVGSNLSNWLMDNTVHAVQIFYSFYLHIHTIVTLKQWDGWGQYEWVWHLYNPSPCPLNGPMRKSKTQSISGLPCRFIPKL
jgi:hypothetical protein